jgi:putative membrane protein
MTFLFFKALHIVGFVAWFAGIFYLVRLFVYHREEQEKEQPSKVLLDQYALMEWRLFYIITHPAMFLTWIAGLVMLYLYGWDWFTLNIWMHFKLGLLFVLTAYHFWMQRRMQRLKTDTDSVSSFRFRLLNEVPTLLLIAIVFLAIFKSGFSLLYGLAALIVLGVTFFLAARWNQGKRG